ncbi:MAG: CDC27 family protein [Myxococcota bacterium]
MFRSAALLWIGLMSSSVAAQDRPPEEIDDPGRAFDQAVLAFDDGDFDRALGLFRRAYEILPHPDVAYNMARCLERLGRYREARDTFVSVAEVPELPAEVQATAGERARELNRRLARLSTGSWPDGTELRVDGELRCRAPCEPEVDPGPRVVTLRRGDEEQTFRLELERGAWLELEAPADRPRERGDPIEDSGESDAPSAWLAASIALGGLAVASGGGALGFGLRARDLRDQYDAMPTAEAADEGETMVTLTNVAIGLAIGAAAIAAVLLFVELASD